LKLLIADNSKTRGHSVKLIKYHSSTDATKYYFSNCVVWNLLPNDIRCVSIKYSPFLFLL